MRSQPGSAPLPPTADRSGRARAKRAVDLMGAALALTVSLPILTLALLGVWLQDGRSPWFLSERIGLHGRPFGFLKVRTMVPMASLSEVDTTVAGDPRVTAVGRWLRACKIDELPQFLHVLAGTMSLVGPRPNVPREVALYTAEERRLLTVPPGITDFASIVFADLADVLAGASDPNIAYNQLVRPWKSRLGLHYLQCRSMRIDHLLLLWTATASVARRWTLKRISAELRRTGAPEDVWRLALREVPLTPQPPPGAEEIVFERVPRVSAAAESRHAQEAP